MFLGYMNIRVWKPMECKSKIIVSNPVLMFGLGAKMHQPLAISIADSLPLSLGPLIRRCIPASEGSCIPLRGSGFGRCFLCILLAGGSNL